MRLGLGNSLVRNGGVSSLDALLNGLQAYWKLDEASGTRVDSKNGYDLADNNSVGSDTGILNNCATFNGINQHLEFNDVPMVFINEERTITGWVYPTTVGISVIFGCDTNRPFFLFNYEGTIQLCSAVGDKNFAGDPSNTTNVPLNTWSFVAARYNPATSEYDLWVNGSKLSLSTSTGLIETSLNTRGTVGRNLTGGTTLDLPFTGKIDELAIWDRALSDAEIAQIYNNGNGFVFLP